MPDLRDRPFALVQERRARVALFATSESAERAGLQPGMTLADARAILPELTVRPARPNGDSMMLTRLADWCGRYSPWTAAENAKDEKGEVEEEPHLSLEGPGGGGLWLDATGCAHLFGGEEAMLADMVQRVLGLGFSARAAMAGTPGAAWAIARYGPETDQNSIVIPENGLRAALKPLPVGALRLAPALVAQLHAVGLRQIGDLLPIPRASLAVRFGETLIQRLDSAFGDQEEPVSPARPAHPFLSRISFAEPIGAPEDIAAALEKLLTMLCDRLEQDGQGARRLILTLYRMDGSLIRREIGTARPVRDADMLMRLFDDRLDDIDPGFGIEDATLYAPITEQQGPRQAMLTRNSDTMADSDAFASLVDRLGNRLGSQNVLQPVLQESHIPERAAVLAPLQAAERKATAEPPHTRRNPRPIRLLRPPEEIEAVITLTDPDSAPPSLFRWRRVLHRVIHSEGPERIAAEWWREKKAADRDYYRVEDSDGARFWLFCETGDGDAARPRWYLHGLFA